MHPAADVLLNAGLTQGDRVGDGIATVMALTGELVWRGFELKNIGVHQNVIVRGYEKALNRAKEILNEIALSVTVNESDEYLRKVAKTALKRSAFGSEDRLVDAIVKSIQGIIWYVMIGLAVLSALIVGVPVMMSGKSGPAKPKVKKEKKPKVKKEKPAKVKKEKKPKKEKKAKK